MELGLKGRTAIVCGASSGIGLAIAESLSGEGANVAMFARRRDLDQPPQITLAVPTAANEPYAPGLAMNDVERICAERRQSRKRRCGGGAL